MRTFTHIIAPWKSQIDSLMNVFFDTLYLHVLHSIMYLLTHDLHFCVVLLVLILFRNSVN